MRDAGGDHTVIAPAGTGYPTMRAIESDMSLGCIADDECE
jgi:hypothetical protein